MRYQFLSHTADLRIRVYGKDLEDIINHSLLALKEFFDPKLTKEKIEKEIEIENKDTTILLIDFLSEVLAQTYIEKTIFSKFEKEILTETKIKGKIIGQKFISLSKDVKAITYHQAKLEKNNHHFIFEFIIDI